MKLTILDEVASTNEVVKAALREGKAEGLVVRARRQSGGYGRQGRIWDSPEGGLYMSMLLRPDVAGSGLATLSLVAGLAVQRALAAMAEAPFRDGIQLKWPNDIVYIDATVERADEYRKMCGISMEACGGGVCVGIGINVFAMCLLTQFLGGALSGFGGGMEMFGRNPRFAWFSLTNLGWDGIMVATLAKYKPQYVLFAAMFLGYVRTGADIMNRSSDVASEIVLIIQAIMILFIGANAFLAGTQQKLRVKYNESVGKEA